MKEGDICRPHCHLSISEPNFVLEAYRYSDPDIAAREWYRILNEGRVVSGHFIVEVSPIPLSKSDSRGSNINSGIDPNYRGLVSTLHMLSRLVPINLVNQSVFKEEGEYT